MCSPVIEPAKPPKYSNASAPEVASTYNVSCKGFPVSYVSRIDNSRLRSRMISEALRNIRPLSVPDSLLQDLCASFADFNAISTILGVAECNSAIFSPVAGYIHSIIFPSVSSIYSPSIK